MALTPL